MSIQVTLKTQGINLSASLKDSALGDLILLIQNHRDEDAGLTGGLATGTAVAGGAQSASGSPTSEDAVKEWLKGCSPAEVLNRIRWDSYAEKILLLGAWYEARGGETPWRSSDMDEVFKQAKEKAPGNFPRDIKTAIKNAVVHPETPRTYTITRTGWNKILQAVQETNA